MYTHKVNIPYYNVYTSFWDTLCYVQIFVRRQNEISIQTRSEIYERKLHIIDRN
jgi:DNA repair photolyase